MLIALRLPSPRARTPALRQLDHGIRPSAPPLPALVRPLIPKLPVRHAPAQPAGALRLVHGHGGVPARRQEGERLVDGLLSAWAEQPRVAEVVLYEGLEAGEAGADYRDVGLDDAVRSLFFSISLHGAGGVCKVGHTTTCSCRCSPR